MRPLTSSIYTFGEMRQGNYLYVDKTAFLWDLISQPKGIYFLARPRRFGKTLLISQLKAIFQGKRELFKGLAIDSKAYGWKFHPVIHLDLSDCKCDSPETLYQSLRELLGECARTLGLTLTATRAPDAFRELIRKAAVFARVVILIDKYDKPLADNIDRYELSSVRDAMESFYGVIQTTEALQRFVFITGIISYSKISFLSKMNHLHDLTHSDHYATMLGYTQEEMEKNFADYITTAAGKQRLTPEAMMEEIRHWYNGYRFEENSATVYNPVAIAQLFLNEGKLKRYWFETGSPQMLLKLAKEWRCDFAEALSCPMPDLAFSHFDVDNKQILPLLVQTGYLTIRKAIADPLGTTYCLDFPNFEVEAAFAILLLDDYLVNTSSFSAIKRMRAKLFAGNLRAFVAELESLFEAIPWVNYEQPKFYYRSVAFMIMRLVGLSMRGDEDFRHEGIEPAISFGNNIYIFKFCLNKTADEAIGKLREKYQNTLQASLRGRVTLFGVNFDSELLKVSDWRAEPLLWCPINNYA